MSGYFVYNGVKSSDLGIFITGEGTYNVPARQVKRTNIPGRNGDILDDYENYPNITVTYNCSIQAQDINTAIEAIAAGMMQSGSYLRLTDTYHPDIYRLGVLVSNIAPEALRPNDGAPHRAANFDISFSCKPQKFLTAGDASTSFSSSGTISNPTDYPAKPLLYITGKGTVTIDGQEIIIDSSCPESEVDINAETMDAWYNSVNLNPYVTLPLADIVLKPGSNAVTVGAGISNIEIVPRWWKL